ncbi:MAG: hypothetical protein RLZ53_897, partial [Actinomycetota bacterium]
ILFTDYRNQLANSLVRESENLCYVSVAELIYAD